MFSFHLAPQTSPRCSLLPPTSLNTKPLTCYAPQSPLSLPTGFPWTPPHSIVLVSPLSPTSCQSAPSPPLTSTLVLSSLCQHPPHFPSYTSSDTHEHRTPLRSMDLPWISPSSWTPISGSLLASRPSLASLVSPSSPHPFF